MAKGPPQIEDCTPLVGLPGTVTRAYISRLVCQESIELPCRVGIDSTSRYHPRLVEAVGKIFFLGGEGADVIGLQSLAAAERRILFIPYWK